MPQGRTKGDFNPRSPHGERPARWRTSCGARRFQSTLPARGATCGHGKYCRTEQISIHAPRTGSDKSTRPRCTAHRAFQSTLPARGATLHNTPTPPAGDISIHAPRTGSDIGVGNHTARTLRFQSTLPARGATDDDFDKEHFTAEISIHAPRTGSDKRPVRAVDPIGHFNPRSPHGERPIQD